jgi:hypothetical protein
MKILFVINTPAQYYFWKNIIFGLTKQDHEIHIIARDYESTCRLLDADGLKYNIYVKPSSNKLRRGYQSITHVFNAYRLTQHFNPDIVIGFGIVESITSALVRKPAIIFTDSEGLPLQNRVTRLFASAVVTPDCFFEQFGKKHALIKGYKEFAYLHPNYFKPDISIFNELGLANTDKYVVLRFNAFDAFHDIGKHGLNVADQIQLAEQLEKYTKVFISSGGNITPQLEKYKLRIPSNRIHHVLYYAQMLVTDTQTMATEAAILGTPAVRCNNFVGSNDMSIFKELEQKYSLIYCFDNSKRAIQKATELIRQPDLKQEWAKKRERLLSDKIDVTKYMIDFIQNYPQNLKNRGGGK